MSHPKYIPGWAVSSLSVCESISAHLAVIFMKPSQLLFGQLELRLGESRRQHQLWLQIDEAGAPLPPAPPLPATLRTTAGEWIKKKKPFDQQHARGKLTSSHSLSVGTFSLQRLPSLRIRSLPPLLSIQHFFKLTSFLTNHDCLLLNKCTISGDFFVKTGTWEAILLYDFSS